MTLVIGEKRHIYANQQVARTGLSRQARLGRHPLFSRTTSMKSSDTIDAREIRKKLGMNQSQFWSRLGVTQSGGSRYESGRNMPKPVQALLRLVHVEQIDISKIRREDMDVVEYLRATDPETFKRLKKEARAHRKAG
jgi:DNA-binding transcriptional regulator YiaG